MSWIDIIEEDEASGELRKIYNDIIKKRGKLSNIMKVHSLNPNAMQKHMELYLSIMFYSSGLSREEHELIAVVVSSANHCDYCINHHTEALKHYMKDDKLLQNLIKDFRSVDLSEKKVICLSMLIN